MDTARVSSHPHAAAGVGLPHRRPHIGGAGCFAVATSRLAQAGRERALDRDLAREDDLARRHIEVMQATSHGVPQTLELPRRPVLATAGALGGMIGKLGGWFEQAFTSALTSEATANTVRQLNAAPSEELQSATHALETLHKTLIKKKPNRMHLIGALSKSIEALQKMLEVDDPFFTFRFPTNPDESGEISLELLEQLQRKIRFEIEMLSHYRGYLEGYRLIDGVKERMSISRADLTSLRFHVMGSLFHPDEAKRYNFKLRPNCPPKGFLATLLYFRDAQQGLLNGLLQETISTGVEIVGTALREGLGVSGASSEEIDTPKYERILREDSEVRIQVNYAEDGGTLGGLIEACLDFFKTGNSSGLIRSSCIGLLATLKQVETFLTGDGKELLSETDDPGSLGTHPVIQSLRDSIRLLQEAKQPGKSVADLKAAAFAVKEILSKHSIWFGSVINLGLPGPKAIEPISQTLLTLQEFERKNPSLREKDTHSYAKDAETLATEVAEIGSYQAAFQGIFNYFITERGSWIKKDDIPVFAKIMHLVNTRFSRPGQVNERRSMVISEFRNYISKATDVFFLKRWALQIFTPQILWLAEYCITNIKDGAFSNLKQFINKAKSDATGTVSIEPVERLKKAIDHLYIAHESSQRGSPINIDDAVRAHCSKNSDFLESEETGCKTLSETYVKIGDTAVDRFLGLFEPTRQITRVNDEIFAWASSSLFLRLSVLPITTFLAAVNYIFIWPVEKMVNSITHPFVKMVLRNTGAVQMGHKLLGDSMFPKDSAGRHTTKIMNQIIANLLYKLTQLLQEPTEEGDQGKKFAISKESEVALSDTIASILKLLAIKQVRTPDALKRFDQVRESSGLSPLLAHMIRLLIGEDEKDLDTKVADAAKELLARCYYLLMDEDILNQQIVLALTSLKQGMLSTESDSSVDDSEVDYEKVIQELKTIVIQQAAHLAHAPISKGEIRDKALRDHISKLKEKFLGSEGSGHLGLIPKWNEALRSETPLSAFNKTLFKEAKQANQDLLNDILMLKAEVRSGKAGSASIEIHLRNLEALQKALSEYTDTFLKAYNLLVLQEMPNKKAISSQMREILTSISNLKNQTSTKHLEAELERIKEMLSQLALQFSDGKCSAQIRSFIESCEQIVYQRALVLERDQVLNFKKFKTKISDLTTEIATTAVTSRDPNRLKLFFKGLDTHLSFVPEAQEIKKLEKAILETLANAPTPEDARADSLVYYEQLKALVSRVDSRLTLSYNERFTTIDKAVGRLLEEISPIIAEFSDDTETLEGAEEKGGARDSTPLKIASRETTAHALADVILKLTPLEEAVSSLETVSSLNIPLDKIPFFRTTEAAIVSLLEDRITSIEEVLFKNRNAIMAVLIKEELSFLNPKTPETTSL
jgi:hypothetical protein